MDLALINFVIASYVLIVLTLLAARTIVSHRIQGTVLVFAALTMVSIGAVQVFSTIPGPLRAVGVDPDIESLRQIVLVLRIFAAGMATYVLAHLARVPS